MNEEKPVSADLGTDDAAFAEQIVPLLLKQANMSGVEGDEAWLKAAYPGLVRQIDMIRAYMAREKDEGDTDNGCPA